GYDGFISQAPWLRKRSGALSRQHVRLVVLAQRRARGGDRHLSSVVSAVSPSRRSGHHCRKTPVRERGREPIGPLPSSRCDASYSPFRIASRGTARPAPVRPPLAAGTAPGAQRPRAASRPISLEGANREMV